MAHIRIPCLVRKVAKNGVASFYWQPSGTLAAAGWKAEPLGKDEGAALARARAINDQVAQWKATGATTVERVRPRDLAGTLGALIARYEREVIGGKRQDGSPILGANTVRTYRTGLRRLRHWAGPQPLAFVTRARVKALRNAMLRPEAEGGIGHHAAHQTLKMGRSLFKFARDADLVERNPFEDFGLAAPASREVVWSPPARELMVLTAYELGLPSMACAILLGFAIGQREQDLIVYTARHYVPIPEHKMQPEDFRTLAALAPDGVPRGIRFRQQKTRAWIEVPVVGQVRWAVESCIETAAAAGAMTILLDDRRQDQTLDRRHRASQSYADGPAGQTRFQRDFAEIREWAIAAAHFDGDGDLAAELATLQFRDLRRTCVVYLGELGMDAHLIAAVTGHDIDDTQRILKTYMPRTTGRAARAIALASVRQAREEAREDVLAASNTRP